MELLEMRIIIFLVMTSVATQKVKKNLTCTEGRSITLPASLKGRGSLLYQKDVQKTIATLSSVYILEIWMDIFINRLVWDNNTGLFNITGLQTSDSGIYTIDPKGGDSTAFQLSVYGAAPWPGVNRSIVSADSCTLVCSVEKAHETTLFWIKGEEILNQTSTAPSLPLTVDKQDFNSSYRCVAANPADDEKTLPVNFTTFCSQDNNTDQTSENNWLIPIVVVVVLSVIAIFIAGIYLERKRRERARQSQDSIKRGGDVIYTDVLIADHRNRQAGQFQGSSPAVDHSNPTTVYDKLEVHRMVLTDTDTVENV